MELWRGWKSLSRQGYHRQLGKDGVFFYVIVTLHFHLLSVVCGEI